MEANSPQEIMNALAGVLDPAFHKPMLELGLLSGVQLHNKRATINVRLSSPAAALQKSIREQIENALRPIGVDDVKLNWELKVPIRQLAAEDPIPEVRNVILVMSGKGGVGKSTCATNLALALARAGTRVGLLDADIYGPSIPTLMGVHEQPTSSDGKKIRPIEKHGVKLMSIGFLMEDPKAAIVWRGPMLHGALMQFLNDVDWGALDYLLLDLPPGTGDVALTLAQRVKVTGAVIVTTPQEVALQDVYKSVSMCQKLNVPVLGVVENMSYFTDSAGVKHAMFGQGGGQKVADFAKAPLLAQIPLDPKVGQCGDDGVPVVAAVSEALAAQAFVKLAEDLATQIAVLAFEQGGGLTAPAVDAPKRLKIVR